MAPHAHQTCHYLEKAPLAFFPFAHQGHPSSPVANREMGDGYSYIDISILIYSIFYRLLLTV
jgi:hypothetical protein